MAAFLIPNLWLSAPCVEPHFQKPKSYGATKNDDAPFLQRVNQWQKDKEKDAAARKADEQVNLPTIMRKPWPNISWEAGRNTVSIRTISCVAMLDL